MTTSRMTTKSQLKDSREHRRLEVYLVLTLLFHLLWFSGNVYEAILMPSQIVASAAQISQYNNFFSITKPYYYYVPLTQIGTLIGIYLAFLSSLPHTLKKQARFAAAASLAATLLTVFIVTQYNLEIFMGDVSGLSDEITRLNIEWAILNGVRIVLVGSAITFFFVVYRRFIKDGVSL